MNERRLDRRLGHRQRSDGVAGRARVLSRPRVPPVNLRPSILDRYLLAELGQTFGFGLSAFALILAATQILAIGRMVSDQHAPLWAAIEVFLWDLPYIVSLTIPMALLLGTLLAIQRLSGESEITAMKAGGITFLRAWSRRCWWPGS